MCQFLKNIKYAHIPSYVPDNVFVIQPRKKFNFASDLFRQLFLGRIQWDSLDCIAAAVQPVTYLHHSIFMSTVH